MEILLYLELSKFIKEIGTREWIDADVVRLRQIVGLYTSCL